MEDKCELVTINDRLGLLSQPLVSTMSHAGSTEGPRNHTMLQLKLLKYCNVLNGRFFGAVTFLHV